MRFSKRKLHFFCFCLFYVWERETEKGKKQWKCKKGQKNLYKNSVFFRWSSKNVKNQRKRNFWGKNCLTLFVSGREKQTRIFVHTICFGQMFFLIKTVQNLETLWKIEKGFFFAKIAWHHLCHLFFEKKRAFSWCGRLSGFWPNVFLTKTVFKPRNTIKIGVSTEIAQNQKWHLFVWKGVFWSGEVAKIWATSLCFWKAVVFLFYWFIFCFSLLFAFFCFCFFWEGLRVRWGGPKGHLTWP